MKNGLRLYKHRLFSEVIEFVGLTSGSELVFRHGDARHVFFTMSKKTIKKYYTRLTVSKQ